VLAGLGRDARPCDGGPSRGGPGALATLQPRLSRISIYGRVAWIIRLLDKRECSESASQLLIGSSDGMLDQPALSLITQQEAIVATRVDPRIQNNFLDANFWDDSGNPIDDSATTEILDLERQEEIGLILPFSVKAELEHPNTPTDVKLAASRMSYTERTELTPNEQVIRAKLLTLIHGNARSGKHDRDVIHLFESHKYGGGYFITKDTRILKKNTEITPPTFFTGCFPIGFHEVCSLDGCRGPRSPDGARSRAPC
jgi:hypothetical protein